MFKDFKALIENQTGKKIKVFRSDSGGEYTSNEFIDFCKQAGIKKETIVPYNPNIMEWVRGRIDPLQGLPKPCFMIRGYLYFCEQRPATLLCTCRTGVHVILGECDSGGSFFWEES